MHGADAGRRPQANPTAIKGWLTVPWRERALRVMLAVWEYRELDQAERFGDADTADVFTEISRETDKQLWLVEAHLYS